MRKDPILACLLNLLLLGTGHMYLGQVIKGVVILAVGIALGLISWGILTIPLVIWAMYDAYKTAKKMTKPVTIRQTVAQKATKPTGGKS